MKAGLMFVIASLLLGNPWCRLPKAWRTANAQALHESLQQRSSGLWLRDGEAFVNIGEVLPDLSLLRVNIYHFSDSTRLRSQTFASRAKLEGGAMAAGGRAPALSRTKGVRFQHARAQAWDTALRRTLCRFAVVPEGLYPAALPLSSIYARTTRKSNVTSSHSGRRFRMPLATAVLVFSGDAVRIPPGA